MELKREMVMDVLPLYLADEVSAETRTQIEEYLKQDEELRKMVQDTNLTEFKKDIPVALNKEGMMDAFREARRYSYLRSVFITLMICITVLLIIAMSFAMVLLINQRI